jgi:hypothetical protein
MLTLILFIVMLVCVAMCWNEGLWGNAITLVNVILSALVAVNYYEPLAAFIEDQMASYTYMWDFVSIWLIFVVVMSLLRAVTDKLSRTKVRFKMPVEQAGRVILALVIGYAMLSFTAMTLHMAPLGEKPFRGGFGRIQETANGPRSANYFLGLSPDRHWLGALQYVSGEHGPLSRWAVFGWKKRPFDPESRFIFKYAARRKKLEEHNRETGTMRVLNN